LIPAVLRSLYFCCETMLKLELCPGRNVGQASFWGSEHKELILKKHTSHETSETLLCSAADAVLPDTASPMSGLDTSVYG
jgi:hypothetical protein